MGKDKEKGEFSGDWARDTHQGGLGDNYARDQGWSGGGRHDDYAREPDEPGKPGDTDVPDIGKASE